MLLSAGRQEPERRVRSQVQGHRVWADTRSMAKLVECVPNFSEGCNKEVRAGDGLWGGKVAGPVLQQVLHCYLWPSLQFSSTLSPSGPAEIRLNSIQ